MSKLYLGDELVSSLNADDIKYDNETTIKNKMDSLDTSVDNLNFMTQECKNTISELNDSLNEISNDMFQNRSSSGIDIDTLTVQSYQGRYFINSTNVSGTQPFSGYYTLIVFPNLQIAISYDKNMLKIRSYVNNEWTGWIEYYTASKISELLSDLNIGSDVITTDDIVNNLTSTNTDKPLAAAQGKILRDSDPNLRTFTVYKTDILEQALSAPTGITYFNIGGEGTNIPFTYGAGIVLRRTSDQVCIVACNCRNTNLIYTNQYISGAWSGWSSLLKGTYSNGSLYITG